MSSGVGGPTGSAEGSLEGTWDVVGTDVHGATSRVTLVMTDALIRVNGDDGRTVNLQRSGGHYAGSTDIGYDVFETNLVPLSAPRLNVGALPFNFTGDWRVAGPSSPADTGCAWSWGQNLAASCGKILLPYYFLPDWFANPDHDELQAVRLDSRASIFGDLGGRWQLASTTADGCTITIEASTIHGECGAADGRSSFQIDIGDGFISGWTSTGVEFTAKRR